VSLYNIQYRNFKHNEDADTINVLLNHEHSAIKSEIKMLNYKIGLETTACLQLS